MSKQKKDGPYKHPLPESEKKRDLIDPHLLDLIHTHMLDLITTIISTYNFPKFYDCSLQTLYELSHQTNSNSKWRIT